MTENKLLPTDVIPVADEETLVLTFAPTTGHVAYKLASRETPYERDGFEVQLAVSPLSAADGTDSTDIFDSHLEISLRQFTEPTVLYIPLADGTTFEHFAFPADYTPEPVEITDRIPPNLAYRAKKGESCMGRSPERGTFLISAFFGVASAKKIEAAMHLVSEALCSKLERFEAALPPGASGRVWNIRKSQNRETLVVGDSDKSCGCCGSAKVETGRRTHSIAFSLIRSLPVKSAELGIAITIIHEIGHQFGVAHNGWLNTYHLEGALWAAHNVANPTHADINKYIKEANKLVKC